MLLYSQSGAFYLNFLQISIFSHFFQILRSMLYRGSEVMREVAWVIFDEIHYMRDSGIFYLLLFSYLYWSRAKTVSFEELKLHYLLRQSSQCIISHSEFFSECMELLSCAAIYIFFVERKATLKTFLQQLCHRIREWLGLEGTLSHPVPTPLQQAALPPSRSAVQGPIQLELECHKGWGSWYISWQPVPVPHHPLHKKCSPSIKSKSALFQFITVPPCPTKHILFFSFYFILLLSVLGFKTLL